MNDNDIVTFEELKEELESEGYEPWFSGIDYDVATEDPCTQCGGTCEYHGFQCGQSRLAYAVCTECGCYEEF